MADKVSKLSVILSLDSSRFEKSLSDTQKSMANAGRKMASIGKDLSLGLSLPLAIIGQRITETATNFEYSMARVKAISGATGNEFGKLQKNAEALGASTIFTAQEVSQLSEEFAKLGFTADEIVQVTESTLSLAQVTGAALPRAAEVSGAALRTFGMDASEVGKVNDIVAVAISKSALDFESFAETMKYAGSQAAISNVSMEELGAAMGVLANTGVKGSIAGTRLRMIFAKLAEEGGNVHENFIELINSNLSMAEAIDRFGVRAATAIPVLQENREEFFKLEKQMRESAGSLAIMQETMDDTSFAAQKKLKSALEDVSIQMGKALLPIVNIVAEGLTALANGFASLPTFVHGIIVSFGGLVTALGPVMFMMGKLFTLLPALATYFPILGTAVSALTGPFGLIAAAIAAIGLTIYGLQDSIDPVVDLTDRLANANKSAAEATVQNLSKVRMLVDAFGNENRTLEEKKGILNELKSLQPDYFGDLDVESTKISDLTTQYDLLFASMLKQQKAKAFMEELNRLETERVNALLEQDKVRTQLESARATQATRQAESIEYSRTFSGVKNDFMFIGSGQTAQATAATRLVNSLEADNTALQTNIDDLDGQLGRLRTLMEEQGVFDTLSIGTRTGGGGGSGAATPAAGLDMGLKGDGQSKALDKLSASMAETVMKADVLGLTLRQVAEEDLKSYETALGSLITAGSKGEDVGGSISFVLSEMERLNEIIGEAEEGEKLAAVFKKMQDAVESSGVALEASAITPLQDAKNRMKALKDAMDDLAANFPDQTEMLEKMAASYKKLTKEVEMLTTAERKQKLEQDMIEKSNEAIIQGSLDIGAAFGQIAVDSKEAGQAMIQALSSTLSSLITQIYLLWAKSVMADPTKPEAFSKIATLGLGAGVLAGFINSIPKMAKGGIAVGEQLVTVGDNRSGREAIIPLERLPGIMAEMQGGSSTRVYGSLKGTDIHISNMRGARVQQRII